MKYIYVIDQERPTLTIIKSSLEKGLARATARKKRKRIGMGSQARAYNPIVR